MKKLITMTGIGAALATAAILGGVGVAVAYGDRGGTMDGHAAMDGTKMPMNMDGGTMQQHMEQMLGADVFAKMEAAMKEALGDDGYTRMLEQMQAACANSAMGSMMDGAQPSPATPGHEQHHAAPSPAS